jgi:hypothetical protein
MDPDVFITIVLSSLVAAFAFAGLVYMRHEHRREVAGRNSADEEFSSQSTAPGAARAISRRPRRSGRGADLQGAATADEDPTSAVSRNRGMTRCRS